MHGGGDPETHRRPTLFTVGHGTRPIGDLLGLLRGAGVGRLIDVRTAPGSRKHPQFGKDALAASLGQDGLPYEWWKELGGFRKASPDSRHSALRSAGFRGYADHMETEEFGAALDRLIRTSGETATAVMCAESLWWRCHRRMLADALVARGCTVLHIMERGRLDEHRLHPAARIVDGLPVYDRQAGQERLLG